MRGRDTVAPRAAGDDSVCRTSAVVRAGRAVGAGTRTVVGDTAVVGPVRAVLGDAEAVVGVTPELVGGTRADVGGERPVVVGASCVGTVDATLVDVGDTAAVESWPPGAEVVVEGGVVPFGLALRSRPARRR